MNSPNPGRWDSTPIGVAQLTEMYPTFVTAPAGHLHSTFAAGHLQPTYNTVEHSQFMPVPHGVFPSDMIQAKMNYQEFLKCQKQRNGDEVMYIDKVAVVPKINSRYDILLKRSTQ